MAAILDHMGATSEKVPYFLSPSIRHVTRPNFWPSTLPSSTKMVGLTGTQQQIADIAKKYRVFYRKAEEAGAASI